MGLDLSTPIYLDKFLLLDLGAILLDGYIDTTSITFINDKSATGSLNLDGNNQYYNNRSIVERGETKQKSYTTTKNKSGSIQGNDYLRNQVSLTRTYTNFYIYSLIKDHMNNLGMIRTISGKNIENNKVLPGEYVDFQGTLMSISMVSYIEALIGILEFYEEEKINELLKNNNLTSLNCSGISKILNIIKNKISEDNTQDILIKVNNSIVVASINLDNFEKNGSIYNMSGCRCRIFGKVCKVVNEDDNIDLLRKTGNANFYNNILSSLEPYLESLKSDEICIPEKFSTRVIKPAMQLIPLSIYI